MAIPSWPSAWPDRPASFRRNRTDPDKWGASISARSKTGAGRASLTERDPEAVETATGFEHMDNGVQSRSVPFLSGSRYGASDNDGSVLGFCLVILRQQRPDLACILEAWDDLPEADRAGIVAMVRTVGGWPGRSPRGRCSSTVNRSVRRPPEASPFWASDLRCRQRHAAQDHGQRAKKAIRRILWHLNAA